VGPALHVAVAVATLWASPAVARPLTPAQQLHLSTGERRALVGRIETQALFGEWVDVLARRGRWVKVAVSDQPTPKSRLGYTGWMLASQLTPEDRTGPLVPPGDDPTIVARQFLGVRYVWGGTSRWGFDCSGLVWNAYHTIGVTIPRDADAQFAAGIPIARRDARPGDLLFYGRKHVHHVAMYLGNGKMIESRDSAHSVEVTTVRTADFAGARIFSH